MTLVEDLQVCTVHQVVVLHILFCTSCSCASSIYTRVIMFLLFIYK